MPRMAFADQAVFVSEPTVAFVACPLLFAVVEKLAFLHLVIHLIGMRSTYLARTIFRRASV